MSTTSADCGLAALCREYEAFQRRYGLTLGSANEHHHDPALTVEQRAWLIEFSRRWEEQADANRQRWVA